HFGAETDARLVGTVLDDLVEAVEGAAADEEDVGGIDLDEVLVRMLAPALRRHRGYRAFHQLQERLLHAFARHVAGDRGGVALARDLVDFVNVDNALLGLLARRAALLQKRPVHVLDPVADIAGFAQRRRTGQPEGNTEHARSWLGEQGLAGPARARKQAIKRGQLNLFAAA